MEPTERADGVSSDVSRPVVLVTREWEKAEESSRLIAARGGTPLVFPTIQTKIVGGLDRGDFVSRLSNATWVAFTSERSVFFTLRVLGAKEIGILSEKNIAVVGEKTGSLLRERGVRDFFVPEVRDGEGLARELLGILGDGDTVFFPRAKRGRKEFIDILESRGVKVDPFTLYETVEPSYTKEQVEGLFSSPIDYATFTSPSTFENFLKILGEEMALELLKNVKIAVIGNTTKRAVTARGLEVAVVPEEPSVERLVESIFSDFAENSRR